MKDASGALVANATVTVRDEATGLTLSPGVSSGGRYNFTALKVGTYSVSATAPGFSKVVQSHIQLAIQ